MWRYCQHCVFWSSALVAYANREGTYGHIQQLHVYDMNIHKEMLFLDQKPSSTPLNIRVTASNDENFQDLAICINILGWFPYLIITRSGLELLQCFDQYA